MDSVIRALRIQTLKAQVVMCQSTGTSLAKRSDSEYLSDVQRTEINRRHDESMDECHALQLKVDMMEREEKEERDKLD